MSLIQNIRFSIKKRLQIYKKWRIWSKYGNETRFHFQDNPSVEVGEFTYGIPTFRIYDSGIKLKIGKFCSIADNVIVMGGGKHHLEYFSTYPFYYKHQDKFNNASVFKSPESKDIEIGNDVWIGNGAIILSGVKIGDGAVIGSNALVSKDIPPYAIAIGNPIKIIRYRFDEKTIERLLKSQWWDLPPETINKLLPYLNNIEKFLSQIDNLNNS